MCLKRHNLGRVMASSTSETKAARNSDEFQPQFINLTNSITLDSSSRTKVRMQVMKEYHRKRAKRGLEEDLEIPVVIHPKPVLSAKSHTHKFRLGQENDMKPWLPRKQKPQRREKPRGGNKEKAGHQTDLELPILLDTLTSLHETLLDDSFEVTKGKEWLWILTCLCSPRHYTML